MKITKSVFPRPAYSSWLIALATLTILYSIPIDGHASLALEEWNMDARKALPMHIKLWLGGMLLTNFCSIFFLKRHVPPRWVLGMFFLSHLWIAALEYNGIAILGGAVSLGHIIFWAPVLYAFYRYRDGIKLSPYGIWASAVLMFYGISLIFDVRDAVIWIGAQLA